MKKGLWLPLAVGALLAGVAAWSLLGHEERPTLHADMRVAHLEDDASDFARAPELQPLHFPADHGPHLKYGFESWYFTGQVATESDRRFAFHLAFFRVSLSAGDSSGSQGHSRWAARQAYRAEFALAEPEHARFHTSEQLTRAALGLGGARTSPMRVWVYDWHIEAGDSAERGFSLHAANAEVGIDLRAEPAQPALEWSDTLFSAAGPRAVQAYSVPRMRIAGAMQIGAKSYQVQGSGWLDHLWQHDAGFTDGGAAGFVGGGRIAWNRFALQLEDGRELLCMQLHRRDGSGEPIPNCVMISAKGVSYKLTRNDLELNAYRTWESPADETRYPAGWRIRVPEEDLELEVTPVLDEQEVRLSARYWAGTLRVEGRAQGSALSGRGHAILTGYAGNDGE